MGVYCGVDKPEEFRSQGNELRVEFHSDISSSAAGFSMMYSITSQGEQYIE